ncbi:hypothetical protein [Arthrobacter sp. R-11]|uniref:hypothetical protein n=1 Tax=Arthrobacter sp. R-11 TaxID=3404053 RepID=UPI003CFAD298
MENVLAVCPFHGVFESAVIRISNVKVSITGGIVSCPRCGADSKMMEGTFSFRDGLIEMLSGPQWTRDIVDEARRALANLDLGKVRTPEAAIRALEKTSPLAADLVSKAWSRSDKLALFTLLVTTLVTLLGILVSHMDETQAKPTEEEIAIVVKEVLDQAQEREAPAESPK